MNPQSVYSINELVNVCKSNTIVVVKLYREDCGACHQFAPIYEEFANYFTPENHTSSHPNPIKFVSCEMSSEFESHDAIGRQRWMSFYNIDAFPKVLLFGKDGMHPELVEEVSHNRRIMWERLCEFISYNLNTPLCANFYKLNPMEVELNRVINTHVQTKTSLKSIYSKMTNGLIHANSRHVQSMGYVFPRVYSSVVTSIKSNSKSDENIRSFVEYNVLGIDRTMRKNDNIPPYIQKLGPIAKYLYTSMFKVGRGNRRKHDTVSGFVSQKMKPETADLKEIFLH